MEDDDDQKSIRISTVLSTTGETVIRIGGTTAGGVVLGGAIGSLVGPFGTMIGSIIGGAGGLIVSASGTPVQKTRATEK